MASFQTRDGFGKPRTSIIPPQNMLPPKPIPLDYRIPSDLMDIFDNTFVMDDLESWKIDKAHSAAATSYDTSSFPIPHDSPVSQFPTPPQCNVSPGTNLKDIGVVFPFKIYHVSKTQSSFNIFADRWKSKTRFSCRIVAQPLHGHQNHHPIPQDSSFGNNKRTEALAQEEIISIRGLFVSWSSETMYFISLDDSIPVDDYHHRWRVIQSIMEDDKVEKVMPDAKWQLKLLLGHQVHVRHGIRDPAIARWILNPDGIYMDDLVRRSPIHESTRLPPKSLSLPAHKTHFKSHALPKRFLQPNLILLEAINATHESLVSMIQLENSLKLANLFDIFKNMEMRLLPTLAQIEYFGMGFDTEQLLTHRNVIRATQKQLRERAFAMGGTFDLDSPFEVSEVLFHRLKLQHPFVAHSEKPDDPKDCQYRAQSIRIYKSRHERRRLSLNTSADVLRAMTRVENPHPLPAIVLNYRKLAYVMNTPMAEFPSFVTHHPSLNQPKNNAVNRSIAFQIPRIHATCHQTQVPTGRLAFDHPNLQSVCNAFEFTPIEPIRPEHLTLGDQNEPMQLQHSTDLSHIEPIQVNIRNSFIAAPGMILASLDYCQIECRLMAHFSGDAQLIAQLKDTRVDIFITIASSWLHKNVDSVTPTERGQAKQLWYALLYGMGSVKLGQSLQISTEEAKHLHGSFLQSFPAARNFTQQAVDMTKSRGHVLTLAGRQRPLPDICVPRPTDPAQAAVYDTAVRLCLNTLCQGSAADVVKQAMIHIHDYLTMHCPEAHCVLNVHDELIYEIPDNPQSHTVVQKLKWLMENMAVEFNLSVPLPVRVSVGHAWGSLKPVTD
jgi:DNA polymerase I-like protein with 3'-5' exonuclease and polymerase domains